MSKNKNFTKMLTRAGIIAALYAATSFVTAPIASGAVQVRLSEALTLLALVFPEAVTALFVGCLISNFVTGCAVFDVVLGSLITLVAAVLTRIVGKKVKGNVLKIILGGLFPVILNAVFLPLIWLLCYGTGEYVYLLQVLLLLVGQGISVYALGTPLYLSVLKMKGLIEKNQ